MASKHIGMRDISDIQGIFSGYNAIWQQEGREYEDTNDQTGD
jgi:hypothetical protein